MSNDDGGPRSSAPPPPPPPPPPAPPPPPRPAPTSVPPAAELVDHRPPPPVAKRDLTIDDLSPTVADRLDFEGAAPRSLRSNGSLPPEARRAFALIWNDLIADIYDELKGSSRTAIMRPATITRVLNRVAGQIDEANRLLIVTATHSPAPGSTEWHFIGAAAAGSGLGAGVNELITFGSAGAGAAAALGSAVLTELLETYLAASGRVVKYREEGRNPDPQLIAEDLAEALGQDGRFRSHANRETGEAALRWINKRMAKRLSRRFLRGLVPVVGMAIAAQSSGRDVKKVLDIPVRPPTPAELHRAQQLEDPFAAAQLDYAQFIETHTEQRAESQRSKKSRWRR